MLSFWLKASFILLVFSIATLSALAQDENYNIEGYVYDAETSNPLPGASIYIHKLKTGTYSNDIGFYSLKNISKGKYTLTVSFIGYRSDSVTVYIDQLKSIIIKLKPVATTLNEVIISNKEKDEKLTQTETGLITLQKKDIETLPYLLGEVDPIRIIQLMPGIHTLGEGSTGFYVRGGAVDQNLMLLDNCVVYNPSHLFGFFSIFNGTAINSIDLYKSGIPSYYGGRLSSITKVNTRKGNATQFKGDGSIGLIATNILLEGPIKKNKGSFLIAARRTYVDLFAKTLRSLSILKQDINYFFYDVNVNLDYQLTKKDQVRWRSYLGKDNFKYHTSSSFNNDIAWQNKTSSLSWLHNHNDNTDTELSLAFSGYKMNFGAAINNYAFNITSDIKDLSLTYQWNIQKKKEKISFGVIYTYHTVRPNNINAYSEDVQLNVSPKIKLSAHEAALFINDKIKLSDKLEINAGIRLSGYSQSGPFKRYVEDEDFQILDTITYKRNANIKTYVNPEPRIAARYSLNSNSSIKISYDKTYQYMHMAPLSSVSLPMDIWVPSSSKIKPQFAHQYAAGYFRNFLNHILETSVMVYYKAMHNQLEYRQGVIIGYSKGFNFDDNFVFGKGSSYGSEFSIKKNTGRLNGMISYTLSKTTRQFAALNNGRPFAAKYDRRHDLSVLGNFVYNPKWTLSCVFVYGTGNALNLPIARYAIQGNIVNEYGARNSFRMPAYHRMDLAVTYTSYKSKRFEANWIFSIYNVYNRRNPYYIYFQTEGNLKDFELKTSIKKVSLFPILPAITYRFKF